MVAVHIINISVKFVKTVADHIALPLTRVLNTCISKLVFPSAWKIVRVSAFPQKNEVKTSNDPRPIPILPVFSKVYEPLVLHQKAHCLSRSSGYVSKHTLSTYRKGTNTSRVLFAMRDDILRAMQQGEVTTAVLADYSKAFDTIAFETVPRKLHGLGFSKAYFW